MWQGEVYKFTFKGKSFSGNWFERRFRWFWTAYLVTRIMVILCDIVTSRNITTRAEHYGTIDIYPSPWGIAWGIRKIR